MRYVIGVLMACLVGAVNAQPPANVVIDEARLESIERMRRVTGELRAFQRSRLAAKEEGLVLELLVREGDTVQAGQVIARLDSVLAQLTVTSSEANLMAIKATVAERKAELERAESEYRRIESLREQASASSQEFENAQLEVASTLARLRRAEADVASAKAELSLDAQRLTDMVVRAPYSAKVISTETEVGEWLGRGDVVVEMYAVDSIEALVDVPESAIAHVGEVGSVVAVQVSALEAEAAGRIVSVVPVVDRLSRLFPVRISIENIDEVLQPGMSVTAMIPTGQLTEMLTISKDAILRDDAGEFVYMAVPNGNEESPFKEICVPIRITRQFAVGARVVIRSGGVRPGARLIVEGNERMFPSQPLIDVSSTAREARIQAPIQSEQGD